MPTSRSSSYSHAVLAAAADVAGGTAGGTPVLTYAAAADTTHCLGQLIAGFNADPTGGSVTICQGTGATNIVCWWPVTGKGMQSVVFDPPLMLTSGSAMSIRGYPGGTAVTVSVYCTHWTETL